MSAATRNWLCIAYAFPPIRRSGTHRTAAFVRHLSRMGWRASVLTVQPGVEPVDAVSEVSLPRCTEVCRTRWSDPILWIKSSVHRNRSDTLGSFASSNLNAKVERKSVGDWISRLLKTPDSRVGWIPFAVMAGGRAIRRQRPEVLYSTSPYVSAHLIAWTLHELYRIPWVADFRDPWTANPYALSPYDSLKWIHRKLESAVVRAASRVVCNTTTLRQSFCERYADIAEKFVVIPNGVDSEGMSKVRACRSGNGNQFTIVHAGQFYGPRRPHALLEGLGIAIAKCSKSSIKPHLVFVGSESYEGTPLTILAEQLGVADHVSVVGPKSHRETIFLLKGADALALIGGSGAGADLQVPNKLFEYLGARRPILAALPEESPAVDMLLQAGAPHLVCDPSDPTAIGQAIARLVKGTYRAPRNPWSGVDSFDRARRAEELRDVFESLVWRDPPNIIQTASATTTHVGRRGWSVARGRSSSPARVRTRRASHPAGT